MRTLSYCIFCIYTHPVNAKYNMTLRPYMYNKGNKSGKIDYHLSNCAKSHQPNPPHTHTHAHTDRFTTTTKIKLEIIYLIDKQYKLHFQDNTIDTCREIANEPSCLLFSDENFFLVPTDHYANDDIFSSRQNKCND